MVGKGKETRWPQRAELTPGWGGVATSLGEVSVSYQFGPFVTSQRAGFLTFQILTSGNVTNRIATLRKYW